MYGVHCQWGEGHPLIGVPLFGLPHLPVMGALFSTLPFLGGTHHQARLEWIDHRNIKGAVLAIGPEGDQNIRRPIITARQEASWLFHWPAQPAACTAVWKTASLTVVPGYPFTPDAAGDCVVAQDVAHTPAPCLDQYRIKHFRES